jgi:PKD repeat protein
MIPQVPLYPKNFDSDENLYLVHDSLRLRLLNDYNPGDTSIHAEGDPVVVSRIPPTGQITLTEQCSDLDKRALSFYYGNYDSTNNVFSELTILNGFTDVVKTKRITDITVNVMEDHHNNIKDTLISIQEFCGVKGTIDTLPFGPTLEGRINFLRKIVMQPKAWFTASNTVGNVPLCVEFQDLSFRLGTDGDAHSVLLTWDFGDNTTSMVSVINETSIVPDDAINVIVQDTVSGGKIKKCYHQPGIYDVKLTVQNNFGSDTVIMPDFINARVKAPENAFIQFVENTSTQHVTPGVPPNGPFTTNPTIRSPINTLIQIQVPSGENPENLGYSYAGEQLIDHTTPVDPITNYTWALGDDLTHPNSSTTKASYGVGGIYDVKLRVDTKYYAYRITEYVGSVDIIENYNLWMWLFTDNTTVKSYEYGLISETFKVNSTNSMTVNRNSSFLNNVPQSGQQIFEFNRNVGYTPRGTLPSGQQGTATLYWASGRNASDPVGNETINVAEFNGFLGTYTTRPSITRQWNWLNLNSNSTSYFCFGDVPSRYPYTSLTNTTNTALDLSSLTVSNTDLTTSSYLNGASELESNPVVYDESGNSAYGDFSVYRGAWKDSTGFFARNDGVGPFFRIKSFYRTEGTISAPFTFIRKMQDIQGPTKLQAEMTNLSDGIYVMNNSGSVSKFNDVETSWTTGGPGINSLLYRNLQDTSVQGFDDPTNTLLLASDSDSRAYLSFDYSPNAFTKFSNIDLSFKLLAPRPNGEQWVMGVS